MSQGSEDQVQEHKAMAKKVASKSAKKSTVKSKSAKSPKAKTASPSKKKKTSTKKNSAAKSDVKEENEALPEGVSGDTVPVERRGEDRRKDDMPVAADRRKVQRRRQIDPTTCERDYSGDEIEFMRALDEYKRASGRMFPTCSEILEVIRDLGYVRLDEYGNPVAPIASASTDDASGSESEELAGCDS